MLVVEICKGENVIKLGLRTHPEVLFSYNSNYVELIIRAENPGDHPLWVESDVSVPDKLSLTPTNELRKGRVRVGVVDKNEYLEKAVRIYANRYTNPQIYKIDVTLYIFNKDGVIDTRMEKSINVRCEMKKEESL